MTSHNRLSPGNPMPSMVFESCLAAVIASTIALGFTLMTGRSPAVIVVVTLVTAVFIGELTYSILFFVQSSRDNRSREIAARLAELQALNAELDLQRKKAERLDLVPPIAEPYRHHENHIESPGRDQGQLTTSMSGATPLFEGLDREYSPRDPKCGPLRSQMDLGLAGETCPIPSPAESDPENMKDNLRAQRRRRS